MADGLRRRSSGLSSGWDVGCLRISDLVLIVGTAGGRIRAARD